MRSFNVKTDLGMVNNWLLAMGEPLLDEADIPKRGMIEENVAVGFLVFTDTNICFLECFITNPEAESAVRDKAIWRIGKWAVHMATSCGYRWCELISHEGGLLKRAEEFGFVLKPTTIAVKNLLTR